MCLAYKGNVIAMGYSFVQNISYTATHNQYHKATHSGICNATLKEVSLAHQMS